MEHMPPAQMSGALVSNFNLEYVSDSRVQESPSRNRIAGTSVVIGCLTLLLLFARINRPSGLIFDESGYVGVAEKLIHGTLGPMPREFSEASFGRQHPPMGHYLIAAGIEIAGDNAVGWRLSGVVCGALTAVAIFLWTYLLARDYGLALTAASLTVFNSFLYVMSRTAMLDVFAFTFIIWSILSFTVALKLDNMSTRARRIAIILCGSLLGLGAACKWNAVDTLAVLWAMILAVVCYEKYRRSRNTELEQASEKLRAIGLPYLALGFVLAPIASYTVAFVPLVHTMHLRFSLSELVEMHATMFALTGAAPGNPAQYAPWYTWPFRYSPARALSYLLGNPVVMWGGVISLVVCARRIWKCVSLSEAMVISLYLANLLQWAVTPMKVPNYYYYYPAAMFLAPAISLALSRPTPRRLFGIRLNLLVVLAASMVFLYCYPRMAHLEAPWDCMFGCWV